MNIKIDHLIPLAVISGLIFLFVFNNKSPITTESGNIIIQPKKEIGILRTPTQKDSVENDNKVTIKHIESGDKFDFLLWNDYLCLPDDKTKLPTKIGVDGKEHPVWEITHVKRDWIFDPGLDLGAYCGYLTGPIENTNIKHFDVGVKISPLMIYNTISPDILISNQGMGLGLALHPSKERFGTIWNHLSVGYSRFYTFEDGAQRNMFYLSFGTKF